MCGLLQHFAQRRELASRHAQTLVHTVQRHLPAVGLGAAAVVALRFTVPAAVLLVLAALKLDEVVQLPVWALIALWGVVVPLVVTVALRFAKAAALIARLDKEGLL